MNPNAEQLADMAAVSLRSIDRPTIADIERIVLMLRLLPIYKNIEDDTATQIVRSLEARHQITMTIGSVLEEVTWKKWVSPKRASIDFYYWNRYRKYLSEQRLSNAVISSIDAVTDRILDQLQDPENGGEWDRRGLVLGHVQSGKTSNYIGLINKASDAGYKVIIVVAGITNILRRQTQLRIDEGFSGRESTTGASRTGGKVIGVGLQSQDRPPIMYTSAIRDFNALTAQLPQSLDSLKNPSVFVIKKNASSLKSLTKWLKAYTAKGGHSFIDLPMLLIDDEADNASINTLASKNAISRINGQLRELLHLFTRSCYVGYTATPFANIFIDPDSADEMLKDDLFPRNFIVSLDPPTNYLGPDRVFGDEDDRFIRVIDDSEPVLPLKHKKDLQITHLPDSLEMAVRSYILGRAIRIHRGQRYQHSAMMVNASVFTDVQTRLAEVLHHFLTQQRDAIRMYGAMPTQQAVKYSSIAALKDVFDAEFGDTGVGWETVQSLLHEAVTPIDVVQVNSRSSGSLDYDEFKESGRHVIAVGGYSLSRGVTLEGLQVSYFLRNSMAYDTLMQMGRWFGYREGYEDLCRIWMPAAASEWYSHVSESISLLRDQLKRMEQANATPSDFGLRVRAHPDMLVITARNKMGKSTEIPFEVGLAEQLVETAFLKNDPSANRKNLRAVEHLLSRCRDVGLEPTKRCESPDGWMISDVPSELVTKFVATFESHPAWPHSDPRLVCDYIEQNSGQLSKWDVYIPSLQKPYDSGARSVLDGLEINFQQRTRSSGKVEDDSRLYLSSKGRVASRGSERAGLTAIQIQVAEEKYANERASEGRALGATPDLAYRRERLRPLLMLHLIHLTDKERGLTIQEDPLVAWSMSFPPSDVPQSPVVYVVNQTYMNERMNLAEANEDEELADEFL